jgi:uncharacterized Zn-finger protein
MPRWKPDDEVNWRDEDWASDDPDADFDHGEDWEEAEGDDLIDCPYCGEEIHEYAERCPHCEKYISQEDAPSANKSWWIVLGVVLALLAVYLLIKYCN